MLLTLIMETFRGKSFIIPRTRDYKAIDETDKYSKEQRDICSKESGRECTLYPFPIGLEVMKIFKPKRWLDPTAGWGDRLRVAINYGVEYVGVDSNHSMQPAYKSIIQDKANGDFKKYNVKRARFQNVKLEGEFDLVFTSPPFFTIEKYENMTNWNDAEHYLKEFMYPFLRKSHKYLSKAGHLVLYIEDRPENQFINKMKEYVNNFEDMKYEGAFYYQGTKPRPYYVWKKI